MAGLEKTPKPYIKNFQCKGCGASIQIRCVGHTINVVCQRCGAVIDTTDENYKTITSIKQKEIPLLFELGTRGKLDGKEWEVIGYMRRLDILYDFPWSEYLLFNPKYGFRWLVEANGHWNLVKMIKTKPHPLDAYSPAPVNSTPSPSTKSAPSSAYRPGINKNLKKQQDESKPANDAFLNLSMQAPPTFYQFQDKKYRIFNNGKAGVSYVVGEFYWRVQSGDIANVADYIAPPFILSKESDDSEVIWSWGEYIEPTEIQKAFQVKADLPTKIGVGPNQPNPYQDKIGLILAQGFLLCAILITIQGFSLINNQSETAYKGDFEITQQNQEKEIVTPSFDINKAIGNVQLDLWSDVDNNWLYLDADLVNDKTGDTYSFGQTLDYYHGVDGGESWSEGSARKSPFISAIPAGTYHLDFTPTMAKETDRYTRPVESSLLTVKVIRNSPNWGNFIWAVIVLLVYPLYLWIRIYTFEAQRWLDSDYSPYASVSEDDE